jgi:hypothetical protein
VWRDGQKKTTFVYRFLSTGSIEEKVFQRQLSKEGLQNLVGKNGKATASLMTTEELRELFQLEINTLSSTYDVLCNGNKETAGAGSPDTDTCLQGHTDCDNMIRPEEMPKENRRIFKAQVRTN